MDILGISQQLIDIGLFDGEPHLLDTSEEIAFAREVLEQARTSEEHPCVRDILDQALETINSQDGRFQTNPIYSDLFDDRCRVTFELWGSTYFIPFDNLDYELLTSVPIAYHSAVHVFRGGGGYMTILDTEFITYSEWENIISSLQLLNQNNGPEQERFALGEAIARFEQTIGRRGGIAGDVGGMSGNYIIISAIGDRYEHNGDPGYNDIIYHQQDCVNEMQTTRNFLDIIQRNGLLIYHELDVEISFVEFRRGEYLDGSFHVMPLLFNIFDNSEWGFDSWVGSNGELPEIVDLSNLGPITE